MKPSTKTLAVAAALLIVIIAAFIILKPKQEAPAPVSTAVSIPTPDTVVVDKVDKVVIKEKKKPAKAPKVKVQQAPIKPTVKQPAEAFNPTKYLVKDIKTRKNIVGKTVIEGTITNTSLNIVFKDIVIDVTYLSKTDALIATQRFVVYEIAKPGMRVPFKFKAKSPEGTKSFSTELVNAVVVR
jgi:hypothetical protein